LAYFARSFPLFNGTILGEGYHTQRQLSDPDGDVTFSASYTPWGDTLETHGAGNFTFGYLGGVMDTATGLLYMGSGQYYDPATGRFLNRSANPDSANPYVPWGGGPTGALLAPLALLSLIYGRKKKRGTLDTVVILVVLGVGLSMSLAACGGTTTQTVGNATVTITPTPTANGAQSATVTVTVPPPAGSPVGTPTIICTATASPTVTPTPTPTLLPPPTNPTEAQMQTYIASFGITLVGNWTGLWLTNLWEALFTHIGYLNLRTWMADGKPTFALGGAAICLVHQTSCYSGLTNGTIVTFLHTGNAHNPVINMLHEMGHLMDNIWHDYFSTHLRKTEFKTPNGEFLAGWNGTDYTSLPRASVYSDALISSTAGGDDAWQQLGAAAYDYTCKAEDGTFYTCWPENEDWADIFANAMVNDGNIDRSSDLGNQMYAFFQEMEDHVLRGAP
jgi:RHS repeat-associated protein